MTNSEAVQPNQSLANTPNKLPRSIQQVQVAKEQGVQFFDINTEQFTLMVGYVTTLVGCALPSAEATMILLSYCRDHFPFVTDREFKLACELNAAGKFDTTVQHYNSFDAQFFGAVLSKYKAYENKSNIDKSKIDNAITREEVKPLVLSKETARAIIDADLENYRAKKNMAAALALAPVVVDWIAENEPCDWITDDKLKQWKREAWESVRRDMQYSRVALAQWKQEGRAEWTDFVQKVINERKRIVYMEYLKRKA